LVSHLIICPIWNDCLVLHHSSISEVDLGHSFTQIFEKIELVLNFIVIAAIFTLGTWVNRKDVPWYDDIRAPLLIPGDTDTRENTLEANTSVPAERDSEIPFKKRRRNIQTRILARFPFLLEILYWLLIYWVRKIQPT